MYRNYNDEVKQAKFSNQELPLPFDLKEFVNSIVKTNTNILDSSKEQKSETEFNATSKVLNALNEKQSITESKKDNA
ncbi:hypothetical protein HpMMM67_09380 [Helicobacter pylori]